MNQPTVMSRNAEMMYSEDERLDIDDTANEEENDGNITYQNTRDDRSVSEEELLLPTEHIVSYARAKTLYAMHIGDRSMEKI